MSDLIIGAIGIAVLVILVLAGVPVAFALFAVGLVVMIVLTGDIVTTVDWLSGTSFQFIQQYVLAVIPLFVFMGAVMSSSSIADHLFEIAQRGLKRVAGGLGIATVGANTVFSAVTGISIASTAVFGRIAVPQMLARGYNPRLASGTVVGTSVLGMLLPPSTLLILYGILASASIGDLFLAGVVPGLVLAAMFAVMIWLIGKFRPAMVGQAATTAAPTKAFAGVGGGAEAKTPAPPAADRPPASTSVAGGRGAVDEESTVSLVLRFTPVALLIFVALGGIWLGWFTPTEAAGVGALGATVLAFAFYGLSWRGFLDALIQTAVTSGSVLILLVGSQIFARALARSGLTAEIGTLLSSDNLNPMLLILITVVIVVLLGMVIDSASTMVILIPLLTAPMLAMGIDPIWFGIIVVVAVEVGLLTPPFGMLPFVLSSTLKGQVKLEDIFIGALPFILGMFVLIVLMAVFPWIVTWLPGLL